MTRENNCARSPRPQILDVFQLDQAATDVWLSRAADPVGGRLFGGTMIAQVLAAGRAAMPGLTYADNLHVQFLRAAAGDVPCEFRVQRTFDGKSSALRSISVSQQGLPVAIGTVAFNTPSDSWTHGHKQRPPVLPDSLPNAMPHTARAVPPDAFDIRFYDERVDGVFTRRLWFRSLYALPDDPIVHECVLSFISDLYFFEPIVAQHGFRGNDRRIRFATTDHAMWFHHIPRTDEWLVLESSSPVAGGGRGLVTGEIRTLDGRAVATVVQEVAVRMAPAPSR